MYMQLELLKKESYTAVVMPARVPVSLKLALFCYRSIAVTQPHSTTEPWL